MTMKRKLAASSLWSIFAAVFNNMSTMIVFIVLARLLSPVQFGIIAFATVFIDFSRVVVLGGIPDALIQRKEWDDDVATTAFWTNVGLGLVIALVLAAIAAPLAASAYGAEFGWVLAALSLILLVEGSSAVHVAKLRREFRHKVIAKRGVTTNVVSGIIGIALAYLGFGVWALVLSRLVAVGGSSVILWYATDFRPGFRFSIAHLRGFARFSSHQLGSQVLSQAGVQVPAFLVGALLGPAAIAQYRVGWRSLSLVISLVVLPIQQASVSSMSRLGHDRDAVGNAYLRITRTCALVALPAFLGLAAIAPDFVPVVFGPQWQTAGYILTAFALVAGPMTIGYFEGAAMSSVGRSDLTFLSSLASNIGNVLAAAVAISFGPLAVAAALTIRQHLTLPFALRLVNRSIGVSPLRAIKGIGPPYLAALGMAAVLTALRWGPLAKLTAFERLLICVPVGATVYPLLLLIFARKFVRETTTELMPLLPARLRQLVGFS